ncbi:hypothetical protein [Rhodococcus sp. IEGM 1379]|uniref:hypothetical protein n=1 Tax=Rhodococcus sp. IEGM 1379 TaxID=3047086 RepID=UPI0024B6FB92|nr:hypothetical protein [Rhodococcus sp. IEGM 1379]MDI9914450.1 hypothetical protein [Rhodococcus sp. IEGM 1379]
MDRVVALGELADIQGFALGGAVVMPAEDDDTVRAVWDELGDDVAVVIVTARVAAALGPERSASLQHLMVVIPA